MSDRRVLGFLWLGLAVVLWLMLRDLSHWVFGLLDIPNARIAGVFEMSAMAAAAVAAVTAVVLWRMKPVYDFCLETVVETRQVIWPSRRETRENTVIVVVVSLAMAVVLGLFDLLWAKLSGLILSGGA